MATAKITIDASALNGVDFNQFLYDYFEDLTATGSSTYYDGTVVNSMYGPQWVRGDQVGFRYTTDPTNDAQVMMEGTDIAYNFLTYGTNHGISGEVDGFTLGYYDGSTTYTQDATTRSELTGVIPGLVFSNLGLSADQNDSNDSSNPVYELYNALRQAGNDSSYVDVLYDILSRTAQDFTGSDGDDSYVGTEFDDTVDGGLGDDTLNGNGGNDEIDGGDGFDTAIFSGEYEEFVLADIGTPTATVTDDSGTTDLANIEALLFDEIQENRAAGQVVVVLGGGDIADYELTDDADGRFELAEVDGNVVVVTTAGLNHEADDTHTISVAVDDGTFDLTETFTVNVADVNEAPSALSISKRSAKENLAVGAVVAVLSATDVDGDTLTYSLASNPGNYFRIEGNKVVLNKALDFESAESHLIKLLAEDGGGLTTNLDVTISVGDVVDTTEGGSTSDTMSGGTGADEMYGMGGSDRMFGMGGDDALNGGNGNDRMSGGDGDDTMMGGEGSDKIRGDDGDDSLRAGTGNDRVRGGAGDDELKGRSGGDKLFGDAGNDTLRGGAGNDKLKGGAGNDTIVGGGGADDLHGNSGADTFVFQTRGDSTVRASGRDTIFDFNGKDGDKIDLSAIDADLGSKGNQAFDFIGDGAFSGKAGELRFEKVDGDTFLFADLNGDGKAGLSIHFDDPISFQKGYFIL
jgi:Ca2+-binding RTX toxin-like protein